MRQLFTLRIIWFQIERNGLESYGEISRICGADYAGAYEKDETLLIARLVKRHLESVGVKVLMTRDADTYLGLDERVEICNNASCDVLVSIHRNLYEDDPSINGVETWIHHDMPEDDVFLAEAITTHLDEIGRAHV